MIPPAMDGRADIVVAKSAASNWMGDWERRKVVYEYEEEEVEVGDW